MSLNGPVPARKPPTLIDWKERPIKTKGNNIEHSDRSEYDPHCGAVLSPRLLDLDCIHAPNQ